MQGDAGFLGFGVLNNAASPVTPADVFEVQITLGSLTKSYLRGELIFHDGRWFFPLSQEESFGCWPGTVPGQIRIRWNNGVVEGKPLHGIRIQESISKEVL